MRGLQWRAPESDRVAYLTYDDGPSVHSLPLAAFLAESGCRATFFMTGRNMARMPDAVREIRQLGHGVGLHGYDHLDGWRSRAATLRTDFRRGVNVFRTLVPDAPLLFRPPFGHYRSCLHRLVRKEDGRTVMWDLLAGDYRPSAEAGSVARRVIRHVRPGSIIVLHDGARSGHVALEVTRAVVAALRVDWRFHPLSLPSRTS